jgi:hypothetical protein
MRGPMPSRRAGSSGWAEVRTAPVPLDWHNAGAPPWIDRFIASRGPLGWRDVLVGLVLFACSLLAAFDVLT